MLLKNLFSQVYFLQVNSWKLLKVSCCQNLLVYVSIINQTLNFLIGLPSDGPASKIILKFVIAVWCALIGAFFVFPGLRAAQMHCDALRFYDDRHLIQLLLNLSFVLPGLLLLFWVKPLSSDYLSKRVFSGMTEPL